MKRTESNWALDAFTAFRSQGASLGFKDVTIVRKPVLGFLRKSQLLVQSSPKLMFFHPLNY